MFFLLKNTQIDPHKHKLIFMWRKIHTHTNKKTHTHTHIQIKFILKISIWTTHQNIIHVMTYNFIYSFQHTFFTYLINNLFYTYKQKKTQTNSHTYIYIQSYTYMHIQTHLHTNTCMYTYTNIHMSIYTHTLVQVNFLNRHFI
jgi:hypothetical protein